MAALDFRQNRGVRKTPRPLGRRWLLAMILLVGVVVIVIGRLRQPGAWGWIDKLVAPSVEQSSGGIDNRLDSHLQRDATDSFVIPKEQLAEKTAKSGDYFPGVKAEWFDSIRDDTPSSRGEQACTLALLDILQKTDLDKLRKASVGRVAYAQMFRQPGQYRGRLVTVSGSVRAVYPIELSKNEYGIQEYYQVRLIPFDNRSAPIIIYCLSLPKGFPTGANAAEEVEVTGFFLKRWAYQAKDAIRTAPTLLAKTLEWERRPIMPQESPTSMKSLSMIVVAVFVLTGLTICVIYIRTRPTRVALPDESPDFEKIQIKDDNEDLQ